MALSVAIIATFFLAIFLEIVLAILFPSIYLVLAIFISSYLLFSFVILSTLNSVDAELYHINQQMQNV
jgi:hypothetical protein